ncbi:MAG: hypothetical protein D6786_02025 [Gammaproteobacteria bacterium]|nr:MAG: hypothetical protein D6786_02025 [Gammaproteobacteria bacterium]
MTGLLPRSGWLLLLAGAAITALLYWPALDGPPVLDDAKEIGALVRAAQEGYRWHGADLVSSSGLLGRPLSRLSFVLNALAGHEFRLWKLTNLVLHLVCGVLLFLIGRRVLVRFVDRDGVALLAAALAVVWLLHPLQVSTVLYTVQRMTILSTLFTLCGVLTYLQARESQLAGRAGAWRYFLLAFICLPLATLAKENGALLPFYLLLLEAILPDLRWKRGGRGLAAFHALLLLPFLLGAPFLLDHFLHRAMPGYAVRPFTLPERLLTEARVLFRYLQMTLWPAPELLGFVHDDVAISRGLLRPPATLLSLIGLAALAALAVWQCRRRPLFSLGVSFFLIGHLLEGSIFPLELMFEHRNYLPMYGILLAVTGLVPAGRGLPWRGLTILLLAVTGLLGWRTAQRVDHWGDIGSLVAHIHRVHPRSERINSYLARSLAAQGRYREALALLGPRGSPGLAIQRLVLECRATGSLDGKRLSAVTHHPGKRLDIYGSMELMELAGGVLDGWCRLPEEAMAGFLDTILREFAMWPRDRYKLLMYRAHLLNAAGDLEGALGVLEQAFAVQRYPVPLFLASEWLSGRGETGRARSYLERARRHAAERLEDFSAPEASASRRLEEALKKTPAGTGAAGEEQRPMEVPE